LTSTRLELLGSEDGRYSTATHTLAVVLRRGIRNPHRPGALVHVLALADTGPGFGPRISDTAIREAFTQRWVLEDLRPAQYRGVIVRDKHAVALNRQIGRLVDLPAWLARARRI
jgi:hypothetical protein